MKKSNKIIQMLVVLLCCFSVSCEDYLEVETPDHKIVSETVYDNDETALSAMSGIYNQLASVFFSSGGPDSVTVLSGLSADDLQPMRTNNLPYMEFEQHELLPDNSRNLHLWSSAYNMVYMTNAVLEGLTNSQNISDPVRSRLEGEARFVRAFAYFYLVNLYGEVPLVLTTDYRINAVAARDAEENVYDQIITDLEKAKGLLEGMNTTEDRTIVNHYSATALLARVQLYLQNWEEAEKLSGQVIEQGTTYEILEDLNQVFLANSREAIWQLSPKGRGSSLTNTNEGAAFIIDPIFSFLAQLKLEPDFVTSLDPEDKRSMDWIGFDEGTGNSFANKYKIQNSTGEITEYSMVLRTAEQYLIRAEARAMIGNLSGAIADLDIIRGRAGVSLIADVNPGIGKNALVDLILDERKKELFTEWGHRWLDLKRTGRAGEILGADNPLWQETDVLYPIPEAERMKNPNLTQNNGY